ncbi:MAG: glutamine synthetase III [Lachnospiraceae bacterium]|nr:glutamine synthetase III [Ruminococcus sp.]MCM1274146.1 glutamine synthetase III [Lachnospiraceae bacterium]
MEEKFNVVDQFGIDVFNEETMKQRLPKNVFKTLKKTIAEGKELDSSISDVVASAMKDWAIEKGATHYTHWFQPMTGITAEKHDSFISPMGDGTVIMEFSGKELIKGEPDASSFPSGGIRATFEARGYTAWDPTSYAFVKEGSLYIPTAFYSYSGEALDKKTPLLRSMDAVSDAAVRILRMFGDTTTKRVVATVGAEQEYFLVDKETYDKRKDLIFTGRTLFGAPAPKGQELEDHYFGSIKERVADYMKDLDEHLWRLGITSKTKHNEVAPSQHENAPIFAPANLATDQNQLTMELMKKIALEHGLVCLLHEKPFAGINGSGKHDNWSLSTDDGQNLLNPGRSPMQNAQFLTFLAAIIKAVDEYSDLLRMSVASPGNDHRLGANEAPPAIISIFLGEELQAVVDALVEGKEYTGAGKQMFNVGVSSLPEFPKDSTDRNRTSPFAFTGNKFEFRMVGSNLNIAGPNTILNTIVANSLTEFYEVLKDVAPEKFNETLHDLIVNTVKEHKRVIFNGNGYGDEWPAEAEKRGLLNLKSAVDAFPCITAPKNVELFKKFGVYSEVELHARQEILFENYSKVINIEALTAADMAKTEILPAVMRFAKDVCDIAASKKAMGIEPTVELELAKKVNELTAALNAKAHELSDAIVKAQAIGDEEEKARCYHDEVFADMQSLRAVADELETIVGEEYWPYPTYDELLFNV